MQATYSNATLSKILLSVANTEDIVIEDAITPGLTYRYNSQLDRLEPKEPGYYCIYITYAVSVDVQDDVVTFVYSSDVYKLRFVKHTIVNPKELL